MVLGHSPGPSSEEHARLEELARQYPAVPRIASLHPVDGEGGHNVWDLLEALFYEVPPLLGSNRNLDREKVDKLAVHGGVKSPTMGELTDSLDAFTLAIITLIKEIGIP